jgi:hypothetical protein
MLPVRSPKRGTETFQLPLHSKMKRSVLVGMQIITNPPTSTASVGVARHHPRQACDVGSWPQVHVGPGG